MGVILTDWLVMMRSRSFSAVFISLVPLLLPGLSSRLLGHEASNPLVVQQPAPSTPAQPAPRKSAPARPKVPPLAPAAERLELRHESRHRDFPVICRDREGTVWVSWIEHDPLLRADTVWLGRREGDTLVPVAPMSALGVVHQPAVAVDGEGTVWCVWGAVGHGEVMHLYARPWRNEKAGEPVTLASSDASDSFADAGSDARGRVWVTWQSLRAGEGDVHARHYDPSTGEWSPEIAVATEAGGDWEPRVSFLPGDDAAWILYDSSRGNEFNLYLARTTAAGEVTTSTIGASPAYEARGSLAPTSDGTGFWIAAERGRARWGLDIRGHDNASGLNAAKRILFGRFDCATGRFTEVDPGSAGQPVPGPVNLPEVGVDAAGHPWIAYRYFDRVLWRVAVVRYDPAGRTWSAPALLPDSTFGQDRRLDFAAGSGPLVLAWPSDLRATKKAGIAAVYVAGIDTEADLKPAAAKKPAAPVSPVASPSQATPERPPNDRHVWNHGGTGFQLIWGDVHRHTDVSNCRTGFDGCINEQFRYAYDMAKLDFLGTSDHTDVGKIYDPYEWWHNQRMADAFHSPERFLSLYVYEREQRWPWGHRNVVFAKRGGPIVYINRKTYRQSQWQDRFPVAAGVDEINPDELWAILRQTGLPVAIVSHTGATRMGTDWTVYDHIDHGVENLVEIYQGARVSYEGQGVPQPTAGLRPGESYTANSDGTPPPPPAPIESFGQFDNGVYQKALGRGLRLGVFASSDHISQHVSYGGAYVKEFTREGIIEAFSARRTIAATDKIYIEFSCNGEPLGSIFETSGQPAFVIRVDGTAPLRRVTVVRNETDHRIFPGKGRKVLALDWIDENPEPGENRYYLRIEQEDGNMGWASPVWVTVK